MITRKDWWAWPLLPVMVFALYLNFIWSPDDRVLGPSERIFYFHMGSATVMPIAYTVTLVASIGYLVTKKRGFDIWAAASAEIGTVFCAMVLISGTIWGRAVWGTWWTWDPTLTSTLILWVLFAGYMLLREWSDNPDRRATYSAVLAIVAFIDVPIDYMAVRWWNSIHPVVITAKGVNMAPRMVDAMLVSMVALLYLFVVWMAIRLRLLRAEYAVDDLKSRARQRYTA